MNKEELKTWFWDKFNNCYIVKHEDYPEIYFMMYDEKYLRYKKFARLTGNKIEPPNIKDGMYLFAQDYKNGYFYCDYHEIWSFFEKNYIDNYSEIKELIDSWLKETDKLSALTTGRNGNGLWVTSTLKETDKLSALTTLKEFIAAPPKLKETQFISALTTRDGCGGYFNTLKETDKLNVLTTVFRFTSRRRQQKKFILLIYS